MEHVNLSGKALDVLKNKIQWVDQDDERLFLVGPIHLPVNLHGETVSFDWYSWLKTDQKMTSPEEVVASLSTANLAEMQQSSVLVHGDFAESEEALVRMHSICHTGDIFGSKRCDCGYQLKHSMQSIKEHGSGALFYLADHEGRGIGLFSKAMAYVLQENGFDTVEANEHLGFEDDTRSYEDALSILKLLRDKPVTLMTNNPKKVNALKHAGLPISDRHAIWGDVSEFNEKYLQTKIQKSGHFGEGSLYRDAL